MPDSNITKSALARALKTLMQTRPLAKISVGDVCEACGMNRKSFYYHFKDKYDLVNWIFYTEFFDRFLDEPSDGWNAVLHLCEYFADNREFYRNALSFRGQNSFFEYFGDILTSVSAQNLDPAFDGGRNREFYALLFADAFRCVIIRWLMEGARIPPEEFIRLLQNAALGFGQRVLGDGEKKENKSYG